MGLRNLGCSGQALVGIVFALACLGVLSVLGERWEASHVRSPATAQAASQPIGTTGQRLVIDGTTPASTPTGAAGPGAPAVAPGERDDLAGGEEYGGYRRLPTPRAAAGGPLVPRAGGDAAASGGG